MSYYWQAVSGHFAITSREQPIAEMLQRNDLDPALRQKLELVQAARRFASDKLALPDNASYLRYADLQRQFVTWNLVATPEFAVEPRQWCFLIAGCFNYRGYFHKDDAQALASELKQQGFDVAIGGAWAYSTMGWFDDPVLNTMLWHDDAEVIGTLFHELAHQTVYIDDDSSFNEAFAMAVEQEGVRRWFLHQQQPALYQDYLQRRAQRNEIFALLKSTRAQLKTLFTSDMLPKQMREAKQAVFAALKQDYAHWRRAHAYAGYDQWMAQDLNNAHLALVATYMDNVPAFIGLLASVDGDLPGFYREAKRLGALPAAQRTQALAHYVTTQ